MGILVLQRSVKQKVMIGDDIIITVTEVDAYGKVKLGFDAPEGLIIDREEVYYRRKSGWTLPKYWREEDIRCHLAHNTKR